MKKAIRDARCRASLIALSFNRAGRLWRGGFDAFLRRADFAQFIDDLLDEPVGRRSPRRDADALGPAQVLRVDFVERFDEKAFIALLFAHREQLDAVDECLPPMM